MSVVVRTVVGGLVLAVPAALLAGAIVGPRPGRFGTATRLGVLAALPGLVVLVWLQGRHGVRTSVRVTALLAALVPGYLLAGWLALCAVNGDEAAASPPSPECDSSAAGERSADQYDVA